MVKDNTFYDILNININSSIEDIKKSYRKLAIKLHPDKNSDPKASDKFKLLHEAYEILSDPDKRKHYDRFGKSQSTSFKPTPKDPFTRPCPYRKKDFLYHLHLSLNDIYIGKKYNININKQIICSTCHGTGSKNGHITPKCPNCHGRGITFIKRQIGPGRVQNIQISCKQCSGKGYLILSCCPICKGYRTILDNKTLNIDIKPGTIDGQEIRFHKEADQYPGQEPGDVIFIIKEKPHDIFYRKNYDLYLNKKISLRQALTGCSFVLRHLDDRKILIKTFKGDVIHPGAIRKISNLGMISGEIRGNLYICFNVTFPDPGSLDIDNLKKVLPRVDDVDETETKEEECIMEL